VIARYYSDRDAKAVAQIWLESDRIEEMSTESGTVGEYQEAAEDVLVPSIGDQEA